MITAQKIKLGFAMDGLEDRISELVVSVCEKFDQPTYVEIGVGHGQTLSAIASLLSQECENWRAIGIELPNGYSFDKAITKQNSDDHGLRLDYTNGVHQPSWNIITVILGNSQEILSRHWMEPIHIALIDGCHGRDCATRDFLSLEPFIQPGGLVMFHDFGTDQVGITQPHCGSIDVRGAAKQLGLLDNVRPGWQFFAEWIGNKSKGGADMGVFQKDE